MAVGFAGIENPLYYLDKTLMLFGDARFSNIIRELSGGHGNVVQSGPYRVRQRKAYKVSSLLVSLNWP